MIRFIRGIPRRLAIVLTVLASVAGLGLATATPAAAASTTCHNAYYPDGKAVYRACVVWTDPAGTPWFHYESYAWNPTTAAGGHTDIVGNPMEVNGNGWGDAIDQLDDGETQTINGSQHQESTNTVWFCAETTYNDGGNYGYRVFIRPGLGAHDRVSGGC
jgi:hypothetical protein